MHPAQCTKRSENMHKGMRMRSSALVRGFLVHVQLTLLYFKYASRLSINRSLELKLEL